MEQTFTLLVEQGNDGYLVGEVVELPGCRSQAKTRNELVKRIKKAIQLYLEQEPNPAVKPKFLGVQKIQVQIS